MERSWKGGAHPTRKQKERWQTDGKTIYEFDFANKRLNELELPPEMQGEGLKRSPLPFVFGAEAADLKNRFWIRPMIPEGLPPGHYMIEAIPKTAADAQAYSKVQIVLSQEPFLPFRIELFATNYDPKTNPESMVLEFYNRKMNDPIQLSQNWLPKFFSKPALPFGWEIGFKGKVGEEPTDHSAQNQQLIK